MTSDEIWEFLQQSDQRGQSVSQDNRVTENSEDRVTEDGELRILE